MFNIYVRKVQQKCTSDTFQFADDTLAAADPSLEVVTLMLTASFNATKEFCQSHGLLINPAKTQVIIFKAVGKRIPDDFHLMLYQPTDYSQTNLVLPWINISPFALRLITWLASAMDCLEHMARDTPYLPKQADIYCIDPFSSRILQFALFICRRDTSRKA